MKRLRITLIAMVFLLTSCTTNYYLVVSDDATPIYETSNDYNAEVSIPSNKGFLINGKLTTKSKVYYGNKKGYARQLTTWRTLATLNKSQYATLQFSDSVGYIYSGVPTSSYAKSNVRTTTPTRSTYSGGTVHVKGYTRKDGTYVRPHTRSAPRRRN